MFYAATTITVGNGLKTPFWHAPWLEGRKPKDIAPLIFECSSAKNCSVQNALLGADWVNKVRLDENFTTAHFSQFVNLWSLTTNVQLNNDVGNEIRWKLTADGEYSAKSAYKMQFMGSFSSSMEKSV